MAHEPCILGGPQRQAWGHNQTWLGVTKIALRGSRVTRRPISRPPPLLGCRDGRGGSGRGCQTCRDRGGGGGRVNPTSMAQNDTHVALIILTTPRWGGDSIGGKNLCEPKFVLLRPRRQHPFLHKTKGPTRNPISTPPPLLRRASMLTPPPPTEQFSGRPISPTPPLGAKGGQNRYITHLLQPVFIEQNGLIAHFHNKKRANSPFSLAEKRVNLSTVLAGG